MVLTAHPHRCLLLYPSPAWQPIRDQILRASSLDSRSAAIKRVLVGNARSEALDFMIDQLKAIAEQQGRAA